MAKKLSAYQRKVIRNYYQNRDSIEAQRLTELVTDIFLAGSGKKAERHWDRARQLLERIPEMDDGVVSQIVDTKDVEALAGIAEARFLGD